MIKFLFWCLVVAAVLLALLVLAVAFAWCRIVDECYRQAKQIDWLDRDGPE